MKILLTILILTATLSTLYSQTRERGPWWPSALWGATDEAGASNWITPEKIIKALTYAKEGKVFELGHPYERTMPTINTRSYKLSVVENIKNKTAAFVYANNVSSEGVYFFVRLV